MRTIKEITKEEIEKVNEILKDNSPNMHRINNASDLEYKCFTKTHAIFSGEEVVRVYEYLKSVNIDIFKKINKIEERGKDSSERPFLYFPPVKFPLGWSGE